MRIKPFLLVAAIVLCVFSLRAQTVSESGSSVILDKGSLELSLVVDGATAAGEESCEFVVLDPNGNIRARAIAALKLRQGKHSYKVSIPAADLLSSADDIAWYRLQYRVGKAAGVVSLSELMRD